MRLKPSRYATILTLAVVGLLAPVVSGQPAGPELGVQEFELLGEPQGRRLEGEALQEATLELGSTMRCPVCQGLSIADSPTPSAVAMLSQVRDLFALGYTSEQILDYFESSYGEFVRLSPRPDGLNLLVWLAPIAVLASAPQFSGRASSQVDSTDSAVEGDGLRERPEG